MSDVVELRRWENPLLEMSLWVIKFKGEFYFIGNEVGSTLGFTNPRKAIFDHVDPEDVTIIKELLGDDFRVTLKRNFPTCNESLHDEFFQKLKANQKILNEDALYSLCLKSSLSEVKPFQKWVRKVIREIRKTGSYTLPGIEHLSLEERKEAIKHTVKYDIPEYIFRGDNSKRNEIHVLYKDGAEKSKDLLHSMWSKKGGDKSSENTTRARDFTKEVASKSIEDLDQMSQDDLYEYSKYLINKSKDIVKEFTT